MDTTLAFLTQLAIVQLLLRPVATVFLKRSVMPVMQEGCSCIHDGGCPTAGTLCAWLA